MIMTIFWLALYVVVNLTSILYPGAIAISSIAGLNLDFCLYALAAFAVIITLGGMKVIGFTDVIQSVIPDSGRLGHYVFGPEPGGRALWLLGRD